MAMNTIYEQYNEMLDKGIIPIMEYELANGEYCTVRLGITDKQNKEHQGVLFDIEGSEGMPVWFDGVIEKVGSVYCLPFDEYFESLDYYIEMISDNVLEGFLLANDIVLKDYSVETTFPT